MLPDAVVRPVSAGHTRPVAVRDVFVSCAAPDRPIAFALVSAFEAQGIACWIAPTNAQSEEERAAETVSAVHGAIVQARALVLLLSHAADSSLQVRREVELSLANGIPVLAVRIEDAQPSGSLVYFLSGPEVRWVDVFRSPFGSHVAEVVTALKDLLASTTRLAPTSAVRVRSHLPAEMLGTIKINTSNDVARIELHRGDLTETKPVDAVDVLVISAARNDYCRSKGL